MSSFLGKLRNLFTDQPSLPVSHAGALAKVYGDDLDSPEAFINRANKRAVNGDVDGALDDFNEAIQLNPAKATAYFNRGFLHNTVGRFEQAILDFSEAIQLLPDYDEAYFHRGIGRAQSNDLQGAVGDFSQALQINSLCVKAYYRRAEALAELGDEKGALADYSQAILNVPRDANAYYRRGLFLARLGEQPTAINDFTQAIERKSDHADAYFHRGYCYAQLGDEARATQDFSQALLYDPSHEAAQYNRTYSLEALKGASDPPPLLPSAQEPVCAPERQLEAATDPLPGEAQFAPSSTSSIEVSWSESVPPEVELSSSSSPPPAVMPPESVESYFDRAQARAVQGDLLGAISDYTEIIERDPHNTQAYYQRGQSRNALGDADAAMQDLEQAIHWTRLQSLSLLKDFSGELADTIATLKSDLPANPQPSDKTLPPIESAIEATSQAIRDNPNDAHAFFERGKSRALLGDLDGAIADYTESIRLDPTQSEVYYKRGRSRAALGDSQGATEDLNHAIRQKPLAKTPRPSKKSEGPLPFANRMSPSQCDHQGNLPHNRFCIHCGIPLALDVQPQPPSEAETLFEQGVTSAKTGDKVSGIKALASALPLFLEQQNMDRYQETMKMIQHYSNDLPS
ncbi:TPR repeat-containing protein YrrB [Acaryochloris thomasi RCC1774]|uniref:TPR repeat-containing protein YrrB n=1 Tax=Acaryochloris thomasi RCC1774 TaxID=1764569 RepID=A0A2W1JTV9_9CYAN|nr:tetratricopeptide repeat protein [Acaryochloris thomasi]PZD74485.1 TPR repeat-containing protein YrrB [Acaryochloris thomasi RCC1774]